VSDAAEMALGRLSSAHLANLARAVKAGWVTGETPAAGLVSLVGPAAEPIAAWLRSLEAEGFTPAQIKRLLDAVMGGRERERVLLPELVVSGPDAAGVPTADTYAVVQSLFQEAETEVVLAGYAFHNARELFERLAEQQKRRPALRLLFHVDVPRPRNDTSSADAVVMRFAEDFRRRHWPWTPFPEVYFDPRALDTDAKTRASLHAKVVVIDRRKLFLTSANFTEAAQNRNIELGVLCSSPHLAERVCRYFEGLRGTGQLRRLP